MSCKPRTNSGEMRMVAVSTLMHKHAADRPSPSWQQ